jgi:hypothetical protein
MDLRILALVRLGFPELIVKLPLVQLLLVKMEGPVPLMALATFAHVQQDTPARIVKSLHALRHHARTAALVQ